MLGQIEQGVGKWLRRHGFTPQRPARRAYQQQDAKVRAWLQEKYPAVAARARSEGATVASLVEASRQVERGNTVSHDELKKELGLD